MNIEHFILANNSSIDSERNSLSIFDLIEDLDVHSQAPRIAIPVQAIIILKREQDEEGELSFKGNLGLTGPSGEKIFELPLTARMESRHRRLRMKVNIQIPIEKSGSYKFNVLGSNGEELSVEREVRVNFRLDASAVRFSGSNPASVTKPH